MIAHVPTRVKRVSAEHALADRIREFDPVYNYRRMLADARALWGDESTARMAFGWRLGDAALAALTAFPSDPLTEHAMAALVQVANWTSVAGLLAEEWTDERIAAIDTLDEEADAIAMIARADEAGAELATRAAPLPNVIELDLGHLARSSRAAHGIHNGGCGANPVPHPPVRASIAPPGCNPHPSHSRRQRSRRVGSSGSPRVPPPPGTAGGSP